MERDRDGADDDLPDTLFADLLAAMESEGDVAVQRFTAERPELAERVQALLRRLDAAGFSPRSQRLGRYRLEQRLGSGAMGEVYRARDPELSRDVAIKCIAAHLTGSERALQRFRREAQAIARLRHPAVVTVYEIAEQDGAPFLVMELVDGGSLHDRLRDGGQRRTMGEAEACRLGIELCAALQAAHDAGIVHRDVKPGNVLMRTSGAPLLSDFGLALCAGDALVTRTGEFVGTPAYASPEVLAGAEASVAGDVYSLGSTLYECVAGRPPFIGANAIEVAQRAAREAVPSVRQLDPRVSPDFEAVLMRALEREPARRYASAAAFGEDLARVSRGEPVRARRIGVVGRSWRWAKRRPAVAAATTLSLAAVVLAVALWLRTARAAQIDAERQVFARQWDAQWAMQVLSDLTSRGSNLWPAVPSKVPEIDSWLAQAADLDDYLGKVARRCESEVLAFAPGPSRSGVAPIDLAYFTLGADDERQLSAHLFERSALAGHAALRRSIKLLQNRRAVALELPALSMTSPSAQAAWSQARTEVECDPRFAGFRLEPQLGLLPLGIDPAVGLQAFWHLASGDRPSFAVADDDASGLVLWLVPPATTGEVPYFAASRLLSAAQSVRIGVNRAEAKAKGSTPARRVSFADANLVAQRLGLMLPSMAQLAAIEQITADRTLGEVATAPVPRHRWARSEAGEPCVFPSIDGLEVEAGVDPRADWRRVGFRHSQVCVRLVRALDESPLPVTVERGWRAAAFADWDVRLSCSDGSGGSWRPIEDGCPGAAIEMVLHSGTTLLCCTDPKAIWDVRELGPWSEVEIELDVRTLDGLGSGCSVQPVVRQGEVVFFGNDMGVVSGAVGTWRHPKTTVACGDLFQVLPWDWARDGTMWHWGEGARPNQQSDAPPMQFGFGLFARNSGISRLVIDNVSVTVRRRG